MTPGGSRRSLQYRLEALFRCDVEVVAEERKRKCSIWLLMDCLDPATIVLNTLPMERN
jgi:hypothetical protein